MLDNILLDRVEDDDVGSDNESENVFHKEEGSSTNIIFLACIELTVMVVTSEPYIIL